MEREAQASSPNDYVIEKLIQLQKETLSTIIAAYTDQRDKDRRAAAAKDIFLATERGKQLGFFATEWEKQLDYFAKDRDEDRRAAAARDTLMGSEREKDRQAAVTKSNKDFKLLLAVQDKGSELVLDVQEKYLAAQQENDIKHPNSLQVAGSQLYPPVFGSTGTSFVPLNSTAQGKTSAFPVWGASGYFIASGHPIAGPAGVARDSPTNATPSPS